MPVDELGIPTYDELVLVANSDRVAEDPELLRLFIDALERGTRDAVDDPEAATEAVLAAGEGLDPKLTRAEVDATLPLLPERSSQPFGYMDGREWERFAGFFADRGLIGTRPAASELLTNELLPDEARSRSALRPPARAAAPGPRPRASGRGRSCRRGPGTARRGRSTPRPRRPSPGARAG